MVNIKELFVSGFFKFKDSKELYEALDVDHVKNKKTQNFYKKKGKALFVD